MMQTHPAIAAALASEHRRTMIAEADAARLARAARAPRGHGTCVRQLARWFCRVAIPALRRPTGAWHTRLAHAPAQALPSVPVSVSHPGDRPAS